DRPLGAAIREVAGLAGTSLGQSGGSALRMGGGGRATRARDRVLSAEPVTAVRPGRYRLIAGGATSAAGPAAELCVRRCSGRPWLQRRPSHGGRNLSRVRWAVRRDLANRNRVGGDAAEVPGHLSRGGTRR